MPLPPLSYAQRFEDFQQHLLHEIVRGRWRSEVAKAVKSNARPHAPAHFSFGLAIACSNARREVGIAEPHVHCAPFYAERGARDCFHDKRFRKPGLELPRHAVEDVSDDADAAVREARVGGDVGSADRLAW